MGTGRATSCALRCCRTGQARFALEDRGRARLTATASGSGSRRPIALRCLHAQNGKTVESAITRKPAMSDPVFTCLGLTLQVATGQRSLIPDRIFAATISPCCFLGGQKQPDSPTGKSVPRREGQKSPISSTWPHRSLD